MPPVPGNLVFVEGDSEAKAYLHAGSDLADHMLADLATDTAEHAAKELRVHAPGRIGAELVAVNPAHAESPGIFEAIAGVEPEISEEIFGRSSLTADPTDWPVFPDIGTGEFGEYHRPITTIPGNVMVIEFPDGKVFARSVKGQRPQHFSERSFEETVAWLPARLELVRLDPEFSGGPI